MPVKAAVQAYVEDKFGGKFFVQVTQTTVGTSPTQILPNNFERMSAVIINTGTATITFNTSNAVNNTNGVQLAAGGGNASMDVTEDGVMVGWSMWAISTAPGQTVTTFEVIRYFGDTPPAQEGATA